jgi:hypothetical protein
VCFRKQPACFQVPRVSAACNTLYFYQPTSLILVKANRCSVIQGRSFKAFLLFLDAIKPLFHQCSPVGAIWLIVYVWLLLVFQVLFSYKQLFSLVWVLFGWCFLLFVWWFSSWWLVPISVFFGGQFPVFAVVVFSVPLGVGVGGSCGGLSGGNSRPVNNPRIQLRI